MRYVADREKGLVGGSRGDHGEGLQGGKVGSLEILHDEHERPASGELDEDIAHDLEDVGAAIGDDKRRGPGDRRRDVRRWIQAQQDAGRVAARPATPDPLDDGWTDLQPLGVEADRRHEGPQRHGGGATRRATQDDQASPVQCVLDQRRLADPGLTSDQEQATAAAPNTSERATNGGELSISTDQPGGPHPGSEG